MGKKGIEQSIVDNEVERLALHYALTGEGLSELMAAKKRRAKRIYEAQIDDISKQSEARRCGGRAKGEPMTSASATITESVTVLEQWHCPDCGHRIAARDPDDYLVMNEMRTTRWTGICGGCGRHCTYVRADERLRRRMGWEG